MGNLKRKIPHCSPDSWHQCLVAMNHRRKDEDGDVINRVDIRKDAFNDVADCHRRAGHHVNPGIILEDGRTWLVVDRLKLLELVQRHGKVCGT